MTDATCSARYIDPDEAWTAARPRRIRCGKPAAYWCDVGFDAHYRCAECTQMLRDVIDRGDAIGRWTITPLTPPSNQHQAQEKPNA